MFYEKCQLIEEVKNTKNKFNTITKLWNRVNKTPLGRRVIVKNMSSVSTSTHGDVLGGEGFIL